MTTTYAARRLAGPCPGCGSTDAEQAFVGRDFLLGVRGEWTYVRCVGCGSVIADPQPTVEELQAAYAPSYRPHRDDRSLVERVAEPLARRETAWLVAHADPCSLAVDIGCGAGAILRRLRETGWRGQLRGVEPNPEVAARVSKALSLPVDVAPVEALPDDARGAGLIVLRHVIEHVRDPRAVMHLLHGAVAPDGLIYVATPDRRALAERVFGRYWFGYDPPRHLYAFTREGVHGLLAASGFSVVAERWDYAPQMWSGSLHNRLNVSPLFARRADLFASLLNPLVGGPAAVLGLLEVLLHRSTMYGVLARRV